MSSRSALIGRKAALRPPPRSAAAAVLLPIPEACRVTRRDDSQRRDKMTWSIIARDSSTGQIGIAVATRFFAVGARVPHIAPGIGGIATQALVNPYYGIDGVKLLREGSSPREVVDTLIATDDGRQARQLHVMDIKGRIAAHTGTECVDWCGHIQGDGFSLAGNMLAGAAVLDDTAQAFIANAGLPFAQRLIVAMKTGEAAGGGQ